MSGTRSVVAVVACVLAGAAAFACLRVARADARGDAEPEIRPAVGIVPPLPLPPPPQPAPWLQIPAAPPDLPKPVPDGFPQPVLSARPRPPVVADFVPKPLPKTELLPPPLLEVPVIVLEPVTPPPAATKPAGKLVLWPTPGTILAPPIEPTPPALPVKSAAPAGVMRQPAAEIRLPPVEPQLNVKPVEPVSSPVVAPYPPPGPGPAVGPPPAPTPTTPPPGDAPVPLTLKQTTISVLLGTLMVAAPVRPASAEDPKPPVDSAKADDLKALKTQVEELKTLKTQVEELKTLKTQVEEMKRTHEEIKKSVESLKSSYTLLRETIEGKSDKGSADDGLLKVVKKLESSLTALDTKLAGLDVKLSEKTRVANSSPVAAAPTKGIVRIVNEYPVQISMLVNGMPHRVEANASKDISVPSGTFDYQLLTSGADKVSTPLKADETLTLRVK